MPSYSYRAIDANGAVIEGMLDAGSEHALEAQLRQSGVEMLRCVKKEPGILRRKSRIDRKELIGFCFHMEQMTRAGLPILEALSDLRDSTDNPAFQEVLGNLITAVEVGKTMSQAMAEYPDIFDDVFVSLVAVGEETGELPDVLKKLTESL